MEEIIRKNIDWGKTGVKVERLRDDNKNLRRYVCWKLKHERANCDGMCENCEYEMDKRISRKELAQVFNNSESVIVNWESGKTPIPLEDLLFYCQLCEVQLFDVIVYED